MFVNKHFIYLECTKSKCCYKAKTSAYYFYVKTELFVDFQICITVPLTEVNGVRTTVKIRIIKFAKGII